MCAYAIGRINVNVFIVNAFQSNKNNSIIEVDGVGIEPTPLGLQPSASTMLAYRPYRTVLNRYFISVSFQLLYN